MFVRKKRFPGFDAGTALDGVEQSIYAAVKPYGFKKHGRTLHRFVSEDISQVINLELGQAYRGETHLLVVNIGIRVPECVERTFTPSPLKRYYPEYQCNLRACLGEVEGKQVRRYDLRFGTEKITRDILRQLREIVLPAFEALNSREAILKKHRAYPNLDTTNAHLILLEEAMIYGRQGDRETAEKLFWDYYTAQLAHRDETAARNHLRYLDGLAAELGFSRQAE